jgi:hypothetical protein
MISWIFPKWMHTRAWQYSNYYLSYTQTIKFYRDMMILDVRLRYTFAWINLEIPNLISWDATTNDILKFHLSTNFNLIFLLFHISWHHDDEMRRVDDRRTRYQDSKTSEIFTTLLILELHLTFSNNFPSDSKEREKMHSMWKLKMRRRKGFCWVTEL